MPVYAIVVHGLQYCTQSHVSIKQVQFRMHPYIPVFGSLTSVYQEQFRDIAKF